MVTCLVCETKWSRTQTKVCPKCGCTPAGVLPAAPGSALNSTPKLPPPPPPADADPQ